MMKMVMLMFTLALMIPFGAASRETYIVGDSDGWRPGLNYTYWASKHRFYVGDTLFFDYYPDLYDVLLVYQMDYVACRSDYPIAALIDEPGHIVFTFPSANSFYFLSSGGDCSLGMRLAVTVEEFSSKAPVTSSSNGTVIISPAPYSNPQ